MRPLDMGKQAYAKAFSLLEIRGNHVCCNSLPFSLFGCLVAGEPATLGRIVALVHEHSPKLSRVPKSVIAETVDQLVAASDIYDVANGAYAITPA